MRKYLFAAAAVAALAAVNGPAAALMIAILPAPQRAITADVVVVGKVTAIEKDTVDALPYPNAKEKVAYKVAVVKIDTGLSGANNLTHIKIGFLPAAKVQPGVGGGPVVLPAPPVAGGPAIQPVRPIRPGFQAVELKEGQEMMFFLAKHPTADFYTMPNMSNPVDVKTDAGKKELEAVKKVTEVMADPMKGLKSDKADVRLLTAATMVQKYRSYPQTGGEVEQVAIPAEESKLILKAIVEADWSNKAVRPVGGGAEFTPSALTAFYQLGLTDKDGWKQPVFPRPQPGQPPVDFNAIQKEAFVKWLADAGKDYQVKKVVAKPVK